MRHTWVQVSPVLVCTRNYNSLQWPVAGVLPSRYYLDSESGGSLLSRDGSSMNHGNYWEFLFPLEVMWRVRRRQSLKSASGYVFAGLVRWLVFVLRSCPFCGQFHSKAAALGKSMIDGIILRCLRSKMYRIIIGIRRIFAVKTRWQPTLLTRWRGTGGHRCLLSRKGGLFWSFPL